MHIVRLLAIQLLGRVGRDALLGVLGEVVSAEPAAHVELGVSGIVLRGILPRAEVEAGTKNMGS
jgi:hypothetical protein